MIVFIVLATVSSHLFSIFAKTSLGVAPTCRVLEDSLRVPGTSLFLTWPRISYNSAISACEKASFWQLALSLQDVLGYQSDVITFSATISACENAQKWQQAIGLFGELHDYRLEANLILYNAVLSACEKAEKWQRVLLLFSEATEKLGANVVTYTAAISACERSKHWQHALDLFYQMKTFTLRPNAVTCAAALGAVSLMSCFLASQKLLQEMERILATLMEQKHNSMF